MPTAEAARSTRVLLESEINDSPNWEDPTSFSSRIESDLQPNSSLQDVSRHFQLNRKQHKVVVIVGSKLQRSFRSESNREQIRAFLGGIPGSGKSLVINALQALASKWGYPYAVATVAYQGVAAEAAGGQTIHKMFGWGLKPKAKCTPVSLEQRERFAQLRLLIVVEISTTDVKFLGMIDVELRTRNNEPYLLFGGVDFLLVGDWLHQLPTAGYPAYIRTPPCSKNNDPAEYLARCRGIAVYQSITTVVMLDKNMRHRSDHRWREILDRWRYGDYRTEDINYINAVSFDQNWRENDQNAASFSPVIVTSIVLRAEFNAESTIQYCKRNEQTLHQFPAISARGKVKLSQTKQRALQKIRDDKTANMPLLLSIAEGMPVQCTKTVSQVMKLSNGSIGYVAGFECSSKDISREEIRDGIRYCIHTQPPDVVHISLRDHVKKSFIPEFPLGIVPVMMRVEKGVEIKMTTRTFNIAVTQVPLIPAFAITSDKCQGLTVERMILGPLRHPTRPNPQRSSFYVAVTRVKTMKQFYLMELLTLEFLQYFKPTQDALAETERLNNMERT